MHITFSFIKCKQATFLNSSLLDITCKNTLHMHNTNDAGGGPETRQPLGVA